MWGPPPAFWASDSNISDRLLRPLCPLRATPQVYQDIFTDRAELDNTVELMPSFSLASLPGEPMGAHGCLSARDSSAL